jgi:glutamate dehydrogenase
MSGPAKALRAAFVEEYYRFATPEDVPETAAAREELALSQLAWGETRKRGQIRVRVFNPSDTAGGWGESHTVIEAITDDSPFIVDSLTMLLNASSQGVLVKLHSVLHVDRDNDGRIRSCQPENGGHAESWTHFEIPRVLDQKELRDIEVNLKATLLDVKRAVRDWPQMASKLRAAADDLRQHGKGKDVEESARLLDWLADDHFTLLGYCELPIGAAADRSRAQLPALGLLRSKTRRAALRHARGKKLAGREPLTITKAPIRSTVHRPALLDDICVDAFDATGRTRLEHRFVGLFTSVAYNENPRDIPLLRAKVDRVMRRSGLDRKGHRGKSLRHILDTFPRDELIQSSVAELERIAIGILNIEERRKIRLFCLRSAYGDFFSCLVYLPRDGYSSRARDRIETTLQEAMGGTLVDSQLTISESTLARLSMTIHRDDLAAGMPDIDKLQQQLTNVAASWTDRARFALLESFPEERALALHHRFASSFPVQYQETLYGPRLGRDFLAVADLADGEEVERFDLVANGQSAVFTVFLAGRAVPLYLANPLLENMGVKLLTETSYKLDVGADGVWIQDFGIESARGESLESEDLSERFEECFASALSGKIENDPFNQLVVAAGLDWRQVVVLRAYCKYLLQCRAQFSQAYMLETLRNHPRIVRALTALFACYFDPAMTPAEREEQVNVQTSIIRKELDRATSLDEDRILRMFSGAIQATLRTNFFQQADGEPRSWLSIKLDPARIPELPAPRPKFEIFVYSPRVEGVHLRCGEIARGGVRWSDRREDFRTEILGLMKAQQVKNTVIVPVGAKGGFVLKNPPEGDRAVLQAHAIECYKTFLRGLLDLTDNIVGNRTVTPANTICRDGADPYLVVAADKGTASFSDTANAVAAEYGFWLGDAFASGGSAGYDHKKMGITARGAWESVKRHFREMGIDSQRDRFTCVGIGDMSGDVFGNGMLLSRQIHLIAAFNHKHIFIDPDPDPATSFAERQRLFALPRSGWDDYDPKLISKGGGVFDRQTKSISLSREAQDALGIEDEKLTPPELIRALLQAPVDLLFSGGIGTYVKASTESHVDAADPGNDPVRVDGKNLRVKVVAEGGNLGFTQLGRIEFALAGGRINTDFIDNSAGVDTSDREVNIKILLNDAIRKRKLASRRRNSLLASMTDEVADLVLANNYAQTQALSMMVSTAHERIGEHAQLIRMLESRGLLNRTLEFLPGEEDIEERRRSGLGLTRPELAVILSDSKIELYESLIATDIPDEEHCQSEVSAYFPKRLRKRFAQSIRSHRLQREIAAMLISSSMINRMGPFFALRAENDTGADVAAVARAYAIVRGLFDTPRLWRDIEALDGQLQPQVQYDCFFECSRMLRRSVYWFLHRRDRHLNISGSVKSKRTEVDRVLAGFPDALCGWSKRSFERDAASYESLGVPRRLSERIAALRLLTQVLDIAELAHEFHIEPDTVARLHFELGRGLRLDWIREQIEDLHVEGHWRAVARSTLRETLGREQRALMHEVLERARRRDFDSALASWLAEHTASIARLRRTLDEMQASGQMDFATLSIALKEIGRLH